MQAANSSAAPRWVVTVPGMHRSGTSVTTKLLSLLGGTLPSRLMAANDSNPEGYFEPREIAAIHDLILKSVGSSWLDWRPLPIQWFRSDAATPFMADLTAAFDVDFHKSELPLLKDPRLCRLFHVWRDMFAQQGRRIFCVIPYRNPIDVVASLVARDKLDPYHANLLYLRYSLDAEIASRDLPRIFVSYEKIVTDPVSALERVRSESPFAWPNDLDRIADTIRSATKDDLRHNRESTTALGDRSKTPAWVHRVYECYQALEIDRASIAALKELDRVRLALNHLSHSTTPLDCEIDWKVFSDPPGSEAVRSQLLTFRTEEMRTDIASSPSELDVRPKNVLVSATDLDRPIEAARQQTKRMGYLYAALGHTTNVIRQKDSFIAELEKQLATLEKQIAEPEGQIQSEQSVNSLLKKDLADSLFERDRLGNELLAARHEVEVVRSSFLNSRSWRITRPFRVVKRLFVRRRG
jgi:hypothetical protein